MLLLVSIWCTAESWCVPQTYGLFGRTWHISQLECCVPLLIVALLWGTVSPAAQLLSVPWQTVQTAAVGAVRTLWLAFASRFHSRAQRPPSLWQPPSSEVVLAQVPRELPKVASV